MERPSIIEAHRLSKSYGDKVAVDDVSFVVAPGKVTGFLGPNGAGKSTTMRLMVGLDAPTSGQALINGRAYAEFDRPYAKSAFCSRPAPRTRDAVPAITSWPWQPPPASASDAVDKVVEMVGLTEVASKRGEESAAVVQVRSPQADQLAEILRANGSTVHISADGTLEVDGMISDAVGP